MQKEYDKNNIFYKIYNKEIQSDIIYEDDKLIAFKDINPQASVHLLIIPKSEFVSFDDFVEKSTENEVAYFFKKVQAIAKEQNLSNSSYKIVTNCGEKAGQIVPHFHIHLMGY